MVIDPRSELVLWFGVAESDALSKHISTLSLQQYSFQIAIEAV